MPYPETIDGAGRGFVASWLMNNVWDTNFPRSQGGEAEFSFSVAVAPGPTTALALTTPLVGVLGATREPPVGTFCEVDAAGVEVVRELGSDYAPIVSHHIPQSKKISHNKDQYG